MSDQMKLPWSLMGCAHEIGSDMVLDSAGELVALAVYNENKAISCFIATKIKVAVNAHDDLIAALTGLLGCAELNQDDLEGDTRYLIENAHGVLAAVGVKS